MTLGELQAGMRVAYVPLHAHGDINHKDVECGTVTSVRKAGNTVFVRFGNQHQAKGCYPEDLVRVVGADT